MKAIISLAVRDRSSRLPSKWRAEVAGKPILQLIVERLRRSKAEVVISNNENDLAIEVMAAAWGVRYVPGDGCDMMTMHARTAIVTDADVICIAGADDPFLDPALFDLCIDRIAKGDVAMVKTAGWPLGLNVWAMTRQAIDEGNRDATAADERQHVAPFWERRPKRYPIAVLHRAGEDYYDRFRVTVDGPSDLALVRRVYHFVGAPVPSSTWNFAETVIRFLEMHPEIAALNADGLHGYAARDAIYDLKPVDGYAQCGIVPSGHTAQCYAKGGYYVCNLTAGHAGQHESHGSHSMAVIPDKPAWRCTCSDPAIAAVRRYVETEQRAVQGAMAEAPDTLASVRRHVATERLAALGAMEDNPVWNAGRAAALLSLDQWLRYQEKVRS